MNAYILVGGRSRRMGEPKTAVRFGDTTLLGRVFAAADGAFDRVIAVQRPGGDAVAIETIFEEPHADEAPIFGVAAAIRHAKAKCFVIAVDYPLLATEALRDLAERFEASVAPMLVPVWNGVAQVLCAGYAPAILPEIDAGLAARKYDLQSLTSAADRIEVSGDTWRSVNTIEELEEVRALI
ncbi:MAG TPA: molybdenum cofactor guanylyltransferase [Thermoanaerobaculia bacterium]|nr:molybdenum cofactor guanylyltransferase [Thermoanaerobaculia bacterium]